MPVIVVTSQEEWNKHVKNGVKFSVVDFTATWCGPCQMIKPFFHELSDKLAGINFIQVDVDEMADLAGDCGVKAMPTFQVYDGTGKKVDELVGASKEKLESLANKHLPAADSKPAEETKAAEEKKPEEDKPAEEKKSADAAAAEKK